MNDRHQKGQKELPAGRLSKLDLEAYLADPSKKQQFVTPMFDTIAPRYDQFTKLFSLGMDARWKHLAIQLAVSEVRKSGSKKRAIDLASGTGDFAIGIARMMTDISITAIDASPRMVSAARERLANVERDVASRIEPVVGDMTALDVADRSVGLITAGYGVRNVPDFSRALVEMSRVARPDAVLVTLDFYRPANWLWRRIFLSYLAAAGNAVGWWWHRDPVVYGYIAKSIDHFVSWEEFSRMLDAHDFTVHQVRPFLGGGIAIHVATRR